MLPLAPVRRPDGPFRDVRGRPDAVAAAADEDEAGHAGGGQGQDGDLAEGVPGPDVHQGHVDDVEAAAALVGQLRELQGDRRRHAGAEGVDGHENHGDAECQADHHADDPVFPAGAVPQPRRKAPHGQHERHQDDGFDQHLGQGEVRGPLQGEHHGNPVAGDGHHQDGQEPFVGADRGQRADHDPGAGHQLQRRAGIDDIEAGRQRLVGQQQRRQRQDERHGQDDGEVEEQRTSLGPAGDPDGGVVQGADRLLVGAVAVDPARHQRLQPGHGVAAVEHGQAQDERHRGQPQGRGDAVPQRQVPGRGASEPCTKSSA